MSTIKQLNYSNKETFLDVKKLQKAVFANPDSVKTDTILVNQIELLKGYLMELKEKEENWTLYRIEFSIKKDVGSDEFTRGIKFLVQCDEAKELAQVIGYYDLLDDSEDQELPSNYEDYRLYEELNLLFTNEIINFLEEEKDQVDLEESKENIITNSDTF